MDLKIIPLSETQASLIQSIKLERRILDQREKDFKVCLLGSNQIKDEDIQSINLSNNGKELLVELKHKDKNVTDKYRL